MQLRWSAAGILQEIRVPSRLPDQARPPLIEVAGEPLSQTVIRERR
jgi:hypothetical protein